MREVCNNCKYYKRVFDGHCNSVFCCGNEGSDNCGVPVFSDDFCEDWESEDNL